MTLVAKSRQTRSAPASFDPWGGKAEAFRFLNSLDIVDIFNNLGDGKSLITRPATTTHRAVGLEDPADLEDDLRAALDGVAEHAGVPIPCEIPSAGAPGAVNYPFYGNGPRPRRVKREDGAC